MISTSRTHASLHQIRPSRHNNKLKFSQQILIQSYFLIHLRCFCMKHIWIYVHIISDSYGFRNTCQGIMFLNFRILENTQPMGSSLIIQMLYIDILLSTHDNISSCVASLLSLRISYILHDNWMSFQENGFYVECGALNGEKGSNTLFFEKVRKWNGILIEADPSTFRDLKSKHRKAFAINACLNPNPYPARVRIICIVRYWKRFAPLVKTR